MAFSLSSWFKSKPPGDADENGASNGAPDKEAAPTATTPAPAAPPASVRTVMPKSAQPVSPRDPGTRQPVSLTSAIPPPVTTNRLPTPRPPGRKVTFPVPAMPRPVLTMPSSNGAHAPATAPVAMPSMPAPAPEPEAPDVTVTLEVGDFVDRLPPSFLNAAPCDRHQRIEFRASEVYSDLTKGRASVPASTIYGKYPALFARPVTDTEDVEIALPLQKIVEQLSAAFPTRADQVAEENVGEIETPFLQVAKEDGERLPTAVGTVAGAIRPAMPLPTAPPVTTPSLGETVPAFPVRPAHRTGQISTISAPRVPLDMPPPPPAPAVGTTATGPINPGKRPPSTVRASVAGGKIRLSGPSAVTRMSPAPIQPIPPGGALPPPPSEKSGPSTASQRIQLPLQAAPAANPSLAVSKKTARIQIPPISLRAGGPGTALRPGQAPSPVPVQPSPVSIRPPAGTDIPVTFRSSPPPPNAKPPPPSFAPAPRPNFPPPAFPAMAAAPPAAAPAPVAPPTADDRKIELGLAAVLRGIPSEALAVEPWTIADDLRFTLPFAPIEKQLSLGRVSIGVDTFLQALPEAHRHVIAPESGLTEIHLPLPEIFQNLPSSALAIRPDQIVEETGAYYPTPFSQKADEDAQRFSSPAAAATPEPAAEAAPAPEAPAAPVVEETPKPAFIDQPLSMVEAPASTVEPAAPVEPEPARDIPLGLRDSGAADLPRDEAPSPAPDDVQVDAPAMVKNLPAEPAIELPAAVEPTPVAEALAVLESTAPAEPLPIEAEAAATAPKPGPAIAPAALVKPALVATAPAVIAARGRDSELQTLFMTEEEIDAKVVVRLVCQLPGVSGCAVMFADGLRLAGNFPEGDAEGFSAMAPPFFKRTQNFVSELKLGGLKTFTVYTETDLLSFFMHDDICLSVRHSGRGFLPGVREKLEIVTREMAGLYSTSKAATTDHSL